MKTKILIFLVAGILFGPVMAEASRLYLLPTTLEVGAEQVFKVELRLDTQGEEINALDINLEIPSSDIVFDSFSDRSSLVNIWLEKPHKMEDPKCSINKPCNVIHMSGVSPGGFSGDGLVAELFLVAKKIGRFDLGFGSNSVVLLNGPDATSSFVVSNGTHLLVREPVSEQDEYVSSEADDSVPPEQFVAEIGRDETAFDGQWFLSFSAQDKDSGVSYYEVRERLLGFWGGSWIRTESPYVLHNQNLLSAIYVRAVDRKGLVRESIVVPKQLKILYGTIFGAIFSLVLLGGVRGIIRRLPRH